MKTSTEPQQPRACENTRDQTLLEGLREDAWGAAVLAFLAPIFGSIVASILFGIFESMAPAPPPGLAGHGSLLGLPGWHTVQSLWQNHSFILLFLLFLMAKTVARHFHHIEAPLGGKVAGHVRRISQQLSEDWFSLLLGNAFVAFVTVIVLQVTQAFSLSHWIWELLWGALHSGLESLGILTAAGDGGVVVRWISWYGDNQDQFLFWLLYSAGICDDLGLPNYKTLLRWLRQRWFGPKRVEMAGTQSRQAESS